MAVEGATVASLMKTFASLTNEDAYAPVASPTGEVARLAATEGATVASLMKTLAMLANEDARRAR